jgi:hypothetical protein
MPPLPLPTLVRLYLREVDSPAVEVTPELSARRLEGARAFAAYGVETPLALLDESAGGSGDEGVLLTDAALYFSKPLMRVPVELVVAVPTYPDGPRRPGVLAGPVGSMPVPQLKLSAARDGLHRVLNALSTYNRGPTDLPLPNVPGSETPIGELARKHLIHREIGFAGDLPAVALRAIALATEPIDVLAGEQMLAFIDETAGRATEGVLVTDRRLLHRRKDDRRSIPYATVQQAWVEPLPLGSKLEVLADGQRIGIELVRRKKALLPLAAFLDEMARTIPADERSAPLTLKRVTSDPAALVAATTLLGQTEPRSAALCSLLGHMLRTQALAVDVAWDFVQRTLLLHHGLTIGRSMHQGWWVSPLQSADLLFLARNLLGRPYREGVVGEGHALDFAFDPRRAGEWMKSISSGPIGQAVGAVFGVGWVRTPPPPITALRVEVHPLGPRALFCVTAMLEGRPRGLDEVAGPAFAGLDRLLAEREAGLLLARVLLGWGLQAPELLKTPTSALQGRLDQLGAEPGLLVAFALG